MSSSARGERSEASRIHETHVPHWDYSLKFKPNKYPVPLEPSAPRLYFLGLFIGSRGSGKTHAMVKLLKQYERGGIAPPDDQSGSTGRVAQRVILFSPTSDANPVFSSLRHLADADVITSYTDAKLVEVVQDIKEQRDETAKYQKRLEVWKRFMRKRKLDRLSHEDVQELELMNFEPPDKPKYPDGCVTFMILDDLIGSAAFRATGKSALTNLALKNRHLGICLLIATQNLKALPKSIRTNASLFVVFRFANKRVVAEDLYEEVSNTLPLEDFVAIYDYATKDDHDALVIDFSMPKAQRFKMNFDRVLTIQ